MLSLLVMLALLRMSVSSMPATAQANDNVTALVNLNNATSPAIQPNFASFSIEVGSALGWTGLNTTQPKSSFLALMSYLRLTPHAPGPILRIGGNSADNSWWNPAPKQPRPPNITYDIGEVDLLAVDAAVRAINGSAVYGVNFRRGDNSSWAVAHVAAIDRLIGWDRALIEIGKANRVIAAFAPRYRATLHRLLIVVYSASVPFDQGTEDTHTTHGSC